MITVSSLVFSVSKKNEVFKPSFLRKKGGSEKLLLETYLEIRLGGISSCKLEKGAPE
ncbi:hypothetical protein KTT_49550 [Tengunoibacter tsumagoiensis]|uniref:Uncharacterized protein n=1 Tax=Tengunoibacter tsumagoiensis TaxID=2014871 RepID=A0A402A7W7_9CHLR|nr:hypothetical protein KTT_49550 [Tengunoibacter tsumagoiensis]